MIGPTLLCRRHLLHQCLDKLGVLVECCKDLRARRLVGESRNSAAVLYLLDEICKNIIYIRRDALLLRGSAATIVAWASARPTWPRATRTRHVGPRASGVKIARVDWPWAHSPWRSTVHVRRASRIIGWRASAIITHGWTALIHGWATAKVIGTWASAEISLRAAKIGRWTIAEVWGRPAATAWVSKKRWAPCAWIASHVSAPHGRRAARVVHPASVRAGLGAGEQTHCLVQGNV